MLCTARFIGFWRRRGIGCEFFFSFFFGDWGALGVDGLEEGVLEWLGFGSFERSEIVAGMSAHTDLNCRKAFVSFGGLLLCLDGPYKKLTSLRIDYIYLLMRKS